MYGDDENAPRTRDSTTYLLTDIAKGVAPAFTPILPIRQDNAIAGRVAPALGERQQVQAMLSSVLALCTAAPGAVLTAAAGAAVGFVQTSGGGARALSGLSLRDSQRRESTMNLQCVGLVIVAMFLAACRSAKA